MECHERIRDKISGAAVGSVSDDRGGFYRDHQSAGDLESSERNRAFSDGHSWGMGGVFPCAEEWIRCGAKQNRGCIWIYAWEAGKAGTGYFDLLSKREDRAGKADREAYGRLV